MTKVLPLPNLKEHNRCFWIDQIIESIKEDPDFDMNDWCHCIGYHACSVSHTLLFVSAILDIVSHTQELLDLTEAQAYALCWPQYYSGPSLKRSKKDALQVLRHLRDTGEVQWSK